MKKDITPGPVALPKLLAIIEASIIRIPPKNIERIQGKFIEEKEDEGKGTKTSDETER